MRAILSLTLAFAIGAADAAPMPRLDGMTPGSTREDVARVAAIMENTRALWRALEHAPCASDAECDDMARAHGLDPDLFGRSFEELDGMCDDGDSDACDYADALFALEGEQ